MKKKILSKKKVIHLARLAKISLTEKEVKKYQNQLSKTLDYVDNLNEINTQEINNNFFASFFKKDIFFEDNVSLKRALSSIEIFKNTKRKKKGYFGIKRIL